MTQLLPATHENITTTAVALQQGDLVVLPTDTVYGVGCDAFNARAIERLFSAKQRPLDKGIPILLADITDLDKVARDIPDLARQYIAQFWPGPLTLVMPRHPDLPAVLAPDDTIAVRIPDNDVARTLIRIAGGAIAATSANQSGQPPATTAQMALSALDGLVASVLDDGLSPGGQASTVVDCTGATPTILREGPITMADLHRLTTQTL